MKLFGTTTSPFVRRVRVVADETHQEIELINTATDAGQAKLREVAPIRRVPVAVMDGRTLFDSHVIIDWIVATRGWHDLAPPRDPWREHNLVNAIDAALDAAIQLFYLRRDGVAIDGTPYATRQLERADAIFAWLATQVVGGRSFGTGFGLAELALVTTLDWMDFRTTYPTAGLDVLNGVRAAWGDRTSLAATRPHA
jgi:glutathione S-transferase